MEVRLFDKKTEMDKLAWLPFPVKESDLPGHTFCAVFDDKVIAIAALRLMEGDVCGLDSMASNQSVPGSIRHEALDALTETILKKAKELGFKSICAFTKEESIVRRAIRHGFILNGLVSIAKEL